MATTKQREWNMKNLLSDGGKIHVVLEFLRMTNIFDHILNGIQFVKLLKV